MLDLDSPSGKVKCQQALTYFEELISVLGCHLTQRTYRKDFSQSYQKMLRDTYNADILDSAQEAFPHMWVNGEKYVFSEHVTAKGTKLFQLFKRLVQHLPSVKSSYDTEQLKQTLINFDM